MTNAYKYQFKKHIDLRDVEDTLFLAILAAEGLFSEALVTMNSNYQQDRDAGTITLDADTLVGQIVNTIFTTYIIKEFGSDGFTVQRLKKEAD